MDITVKYTNPLAALSVVDCNVAKNFIFGGMAGAASKTMVAPIERIKLLLQVQSAAKNMKLEQHYKGFTDCLLRIPREQGFSSFWRGNTINVVRGFPKSAIIFASKDKYQELLVRTFFTNQDCNYHKSASNVLSGSAAGFTALCFLQPLDFARTRLAADTGRSASQREFKGLSDCLAKTVKADGFRGLYRGFLVSVPEIIIFRGAYFGLYDCLKQVLGLKRKETSFWVSYLVAQIATTASGLIAYPFDTVRRRMMMQSGVPRSEQLYKNTASCWVKVYNEGGLRSFYRGGLPNVLRGFGGALVLVVYDMLKDSL
ncbi:ADP,ATP carrier protein 1 [Halotydeus destructor]|nr:ADP,ATP carrier protein 1 [Halotydeus destructor]